MLALELAGHLDLVEVSGTWTVEAVAVGSSGTV